MVLGCFFLYFGEFWAPWASMAPVGLSVSPLRVGSGLGLVPPPPRSTVVLSCRPGGCRRMVATLCCAIVLPGGKSGFPAGFR